MNNTAPVFDIGHIPDRVPPQNLECEEAILGGILLDKDAIARIEDLTPEDFYFTNNGVIFRYALNIHRKGQLVDLMTVTTALADAGVLDQIGGQAKMARLLDSCVGTVNLEKYAELVKEKRWRRDVIKTGRNLANLGYEAKSAENLANEVEAKLMLLTQESGGSTVQEASDCLAGLFSKIEARANGVEDDTVQTGFYDLDSITEGFRRGDLIIVAGRPSMGKTAFCTNIARHVLEKYHFPILFISKEMSAEQLWTRLLSQEIKVDATSVGKGRLSEGEWVSLNSALASLSELPLLIEENPMVTVPGIRSLARRIKAQRGDLGMIVIDYLQLFGGKDNRVQEMGEITRSLKLLAKELQVPIVLLSQLSRGVESRSDRRPMMSDLRDSGSIEQDADLILMLYRDEYYNPHTEDRGIAEVICTKNRNGATGTIKLLFQPKFTQFLNLG